MTLRMKLILMTTVVVTVLFGVAEWLSYQQTTALLEEHERILTETADHGVALQKLRATKERMFLSVTTVRVLHAVITLLVAVAALNSVWYSVVYRPIQRLLGHINSMGRGTWHSPIPVKRRDEIGELTAAFNELGQQLTSAFDHINSATKLSAFALIGGRLLRRITSFRSEVAAALKYYDRRDDRGYSTGREILTSVEKQLEHLEEQFQKDFDQLFSSTAQEPAGAPEQTLAAAPNRSDNRKNSKR
jgi:HAMP domain-containing protein